jgi:transposase
MFIRKTQIGKRKGGGHYYTYRLVENYRVGNKVIQRTLVNLGSDFSFPEEHLPALCSRIKEILHNQKSIFNEVSEVESMAQNIAARVLVSQQELHPDNTHDYREVDINSMELSRPRSVGCEHVMLEALRQLGLEAKLESLGFTGPQKALAIGSIIARACHPASELETHRWLREQSGIGELIGYDFDQVTLYKIYQISDLLLQNKSAIEEHLFKQERDIFAFQETITLYDLTNTYFEGRAGMSKLAQYGHSKEKRSDCPLVTLGLVLDGSGFPQRSYVYKGNVSEPATLSEMLNCLHQPEETPISRKPTVVMDAGIATDANIKWLIENDYPYIVVSRKSHRKFDDAEAVTVQEKGEYKVKVQKVFDEERGETLLYCHSTQKEEKERSMTQQVSKRFEEALLHLHEGLSKKKRLKKYDKVIEKIGRLKQQFSKAAKSYKITVQKDEKTGNASKITWEQKSVPGTIDTHPGVYCLRTSHKELDEKQLWKTYTMLTDLEAVFRSLKSELGLRPIHHRIDDRIIGHLFITVLAYHLVHFVRRRLKQGGIHDSWNTLRNTLLPLCRVTMSMSCQKCEVVHIRKSTRPEAAQHVIFSLLGMADYPGPIQKTIIQTAQRCSDIRGGDHPPSG